MYTIADIAAWSWIYGLLNNYDDAPKVRFYHNHKLHYIMLCSVVDV